VTATKEDTKKTQVNDLAHGGSVEGSPPVDLLVVIPAFNEDGGVGPTIRRLRDALAGSERSSRILVVDDGSTDDTGEEARAQGVEVLRHPTNLGYGAALKSGIAAGSSEFVGIIDADGTYPPEEMPRLLELAADAQADMVVGTRDPADKSIPIERRPGKWMIGRLAEYLVQQKIPDVNSGLRVFRRSALLQFLDILPDGFSFTTTITLAMLSTGHHVIHQPVQCSRRVGSSKLRAADFTTFVMVVLRTVVLFNPLRVFLPLGTLLFLVGFGKFVYDVTLWNLSETAVMGFLGAIVVWSVGLLADMIARMQLHRPRPPS
jgi:glycosyltransferase involved in cell wall biosynthesis